MTDDRQRIVAELKLHPGYTALRELVKEWREQYYTELGKALYSGQATLAESDLDFKRGYFKGMNRLLNEAVFSYAAVERDLQRSEVNELE